MSTALARHRARARTAADGTLAQQNPMVDNIVIDSENMVIIVINDG